MNVTQENSPGAWPWITASECLLMAVTLRERQNKHMQRPQRGTGRRERAHPSAASASCLHRRQGWRRALTCSVKTPSRVFTSCAAVEDLGLWSP